MTKDDNLLSTNAHLTAVFPETPATELTGRLAEQGYLVVRNLIPLDNLLDVRKHMYATMTGLHLASHVRGDRPVFPVEGLMDAPVDTFSEATRAIWGYEPLHRLAHAPQIVEFIARLLDVEVFVHPQKVLRLIAPEDDDMLIQHIAGPHQDFPELQGSRRQLTVWIPFHSVDSVSGTLPIYPGSHRDGVRPLRLAANPSGWQADVRGLASPVYHQLDPGDAIVFTTYTVHGGARNLSDSYRMSMDVRYQPLADPVCESAFSLPGYNFGWEDIYRDWPAHADDLRYYWRQLPLKVQPHDLAWEDWRDRAAVAAGERGEEVALRALMIAAQRSSSTFLGKRAAELLASPPFSDLL